MKRTILAFVVAPLVPAVAIFHDAGPGLAFIYSYGLTYLFGIPVFFVLKRKRKETHLRYMTCGAIAAAFVLVFIYLANGARDPALLAIAAILAVVGACEGLCFSLIRGRERRILEPNHLPDPTSRSVTPPAGAGGAPAGADH